MTLRFLLKHSLRSLSGAYVHLSFSTSLVMISENQAYYSMGRATYCVPMTLFAKNREKLITQLGKIDVGYHDVVLLQGGEPIHHYSTDVEYVFQQEPYFHWMFGVTEPGYYGLLKLKTGEALLFIPNLPKEYEIWMGKLPTPNDIKKKYNVDEVYYVNQLLAVMKELDPGTIYTLSGINTDSNLECQEAYFEGITSFKVDNVKLHPAITECRVIKSREEIDVMRYVNRISSEAHKLVMRTIKPGSYEYEAEATFMNYCYTYGGCRNVSYTCICGSGHNASILHYGHAAAPNTKLIYDGDMCLFDMGASYYGYSSDITVSFPINGKFSEKQKIIYNAVLQARNAVLDSLKPGVSWVKMHLLANEVMLRELCCNGLLQGKVEDMLEDDIASIFQPHGLGHFLGCDVHDVGGYMADTPERPTRPGMRCLRTARKLKVGMVITVEPGCYFIDALIDQALNDEVKKKYLVPSMIEQYRGFGGVRIEDDVLITETGVENLTKVPRTIEEIENFMSDKADSFIKRNEI